VTRPQPVVVDIGARSRRRVLIGSLVAGALGITALFGAVSAFTGGETAGGVIASLVGSLLSGVALLGALSWKRVTRPRLLVFDAAGIRWDDPLGTPWAVAWQELGAVSISRTRERAVKLADAVVRKTLVRLDLFPADPRFRARHPEMEHMWEFHRVREGYRLPLGDSADLIPVVERAMTRFAPQVYRGVRDEGFTLGLT
jgi:hypothetical protein